MCMCTAQRLSCAPRAPRSVAVARRVGIAAIPARPVLTPRRHVAARHLVITAAVSELGAKMQPFSGCNCYHLLEKMGQDKSMVVQTLDDVHNMGFSVIRMWAFNDGDSGRMLQITPGELNPEGREDLDKLFQALDDVNVKYSPKAPMRFMMTFTNHLKDYGGHKWYMRKATNNQNDNADDFYTNDKAQGAYKSYVTNLINHCKTGKTRRGTPYFDLIHSWDICNEPRNASHQKPKDVTAWIAKAAEAIKEADGGAKPVTVGLEGFYGPDDTDHLAGNPYSGTELEGVDFTAIGKLDNIDFMSIHLWPDQWGKPKPQEVISWGRDWITGHMKVCQENLGGKPLCLQEYNMAVGARNGSSQATLADRKALFEMVRNLMKDPNVNKDNILVGSLVWMIADAAYANYDNYGHMVVRGRDPASDTVLTQMCIEAMGRQRGADS